ncbi:PDZ and LIM domain protein 5 [Gastrophryne carolinensis]
MSNYSVSLFGPAPWGFRLQGGKDFNMPLTISRLSDGGKAAKANIGIGDVVLTIDGISTDGMTHLEAQNKIKACTGSLSLTLQKAAAVAKNNPPQTEAPKEIIKPVPIASPTSAAPKVTTSANMTYNKAPRPFGAPSPTPPSSKPASIPSSSSAFTPASASQASAQPSAFSLLATVSAPPPTASGVHASYKPTTDGQTPAFNATKPAVNVPRQPASYNSSVNLYASEVAHDVADVHRRGQKENLVDKSQNGPPRKHIVDTDAEFYHTPTFSDASKKRLVDQTEDWHPRTGTTQSRSFRILAQMTGTENLSEPEHEDVKKNNGSVETTAAAYSVAPAKSMPASFKAAPAASKPSGPASTVKPGWQPAPSTGRISSLQSTKTQVANNKPFAPPPLDDQDTLFQRAEHIPAGTRTPVCANCNLVIRGPFLLALGKSWHPEEFNCAHCKKNMAEMGFVLEKGTYYCEVCYERFFAPDCARCQRKILGEVINALKQTWHVSCFVCVACHTPIRNNVFHLEDGDPYCETDYYSLFGTMCHGCEFPIEAGDRFLEALGNTWHDTCFVCSVCCESLEGQTFFAKKDKPLCKKHAHAVNM